MIDNELLMWSIISGGTLLAFLPIEWLLSITIVCHRFQGYTRGLQSELPPWDLDIICGICGKWRKDAANGFARPLGKSATHINGTRSHVGENIDDEEQKHLRLQVAT